MKTCVKFCLILVISLLSTSYSHAQFDVTLDGDNGGKTFVLPLSHADNQVYTIGVRNGGIFQMKPADYIPGVTWWATPLLSPTTDVLTHIGPGRYGVHYQRSSNNIWTILDVYIRYYVDIINTTSGNTTFNQMVDTVWLLPNQTTARLNAGSNFAGIWWKKDGGSNVLWDNTASNMGDFSINVGIGTYMFVARDWSSYDSYDTVTVAYALSPALASPTALAQEISIASSELGVSYSLFQKSTLKSSDPWIEVPASSKLGTGTALSWTSLDNGEYRINAATSKVGNSYTYLYPNVLTLSAATNLLQMGEQGSGITIYPNPTQGIVTIASEDVIQKIEIFDINGLLAYSLAVNATSQTINVSQLTLGIYTVKTTTAKGQQCSRLVRCN